MTTTPRIYVTLVNTVLGRVVQGAWIDLDQPLSDVYRDIEDALAGAPGPGLIAIRDEEGFEPLHLFGHEQLDYVVAVAHGIIVYGEAFACWARMIGDRRVSQLEAFTSRYIGSFDTVRGYAKLWLDASGEPDPTEQAIQDCVGVLAEIDTIVAGPTQIHVFGGWAK